jgi:hypothetical protein
VVLNLIYVFALYILLTNNPVVFVLKGATLLSNFVKKTLMHGLKFVIVCSPNIIRVISNREDEMREACGTYSGEEKRIKGFSGEA